MKTDNVGDFVVVAPRAFEVGEVKVDCLGLQDRPKCLANGLLETALEAMLIPDMYAIGFRGMGAIGIR